MIFFPMLSFLLVDIEKIYSSTTRRVLVHADELENSEKSTLKRTLIGVPLLNF